MTKKQRAEKILSVLEGQTFNDFYALDGKFENYITHEYPEGHPQHVSKEDVLKKVEELFASAL